MVLALAAIDPSAANFPAKASGLQDLVEDRTEYEETRLFPKIHRYVRRGARDTSSTRAGASSPAVLLAMGGESSAPTRHSFGSVVDRFAGWRVFPWARLDDRRFIRRRRPSEGLGPSHSSRLGPAGLISELNLSMGSRGAEE
jgi:hypothetical protein